MGCDIAAPLWIVLRAHERPLVSDMQVTRPHACDVSRKVLREMVQDRERWGLRVRGKVAEVEWPEVSLPGDMPGEWQRRPGAEHPHS